MTAVLSDAFTRADTSSGLDSAPTGGAWKQYASTNFKILSNAAMKATGTGSVRYFALLGASAIAGAFTATINFRSSATTNTTDLGVAVLALDNIGARGGQLYVSIRKTGSANSCRLMLRTNTSGTDTALYTNSSAAWADDTDYTVVVEVGAPDGSGNRLVDAKRAGISLLGGGVTVTAAQLAGLGTDAGISFTNTDAGSKIYDFVLDDPALSPPEPEATSTKPVVHRGTQSSDRHTEENELGLATLPPGAAVEVDMRVSSDGVVHLCHDADILAVSNPAGTGSVESNTSAYLTAHGIMKAEDYFIACAQYGISYVLAQHYTGTSQANVQPCVDVCNASPMAARIIFMTSLSSPFAPQAIRDAGWEGYMGTYGAQTSTQTTLEAADLNYNFKLAFLPPGDSAYNTNRAFVATLHGLGIEAGGSTIDTSTGMAHVVEDDCEWILTDDLDLFLSLYTPPAAPQVFVSRWTGSHEIAVEVGGVWDESEVIPVTLELAP